MSDEASTSTSLERFIGIASGGLLLLMALSMLGWAARLAVAGLSTEAWPPGLGQLLFATTVTAVLVGIGSWRLLLLGLPSRIRGISLGRLILAGFGTAAVVGALL